MAIPEFDAHGLLPAGIHDCTLDETRARFGAFQESDRRPQLWTKFADFIRDVEASGLVQEVLLDGSFVTAKPAPNDVDLILVVPSTHDFSADFLPAEYNIISKRRVARRFGFDLLVARSGSEELARYVKFFQQVRLEPGKTKGILRIIL